MTEITKAVEESPKTAAQAADNRDGENKQEQTAEDEDPEPPANTITNIKSNVVKQIEEKATYDNVNDKYEVREAANENNKAQMESEKETQKQNNEEPINNLAKTVQNRAAKATATYPDHWKNKDNLQVREEMLPLNAVGKADVEYTVIVKYVGDSGAVSGVIELNDPISSDITIDESSIVVHSVETIPGTAGGYIGGRVTETPHIVNENGVNYLRGGFDNFYTNNQIRISFKCTISKTDGVTKQSGEYYYWDNTAYVTSSESSDVSKTNRLWWVDVANQAPDQGEEKFILSYKYEGNIPDGVILPVNEEYKQGDAGYTCSKTNTSERIYI